jgi:membrane associated rhomboid family serine protease
MLTIIVVAITALISYAAFNNNELYNKLLLWPRKMDNPVEYYRLLTSGFIHADWNHLIFNMLTLYLVGQGVEQMIGPLYMLLYITGIIVSSLPSFIKNRHNSYYRSLGASGGVASILFFSIYFFPWSRIYLFFIPIGIPSILFAVAYLIYSAVMSRRGDGKINHDAHFFGSIYGLIFALIIDPSHGGTFLFELMHPR